jgi:uncharacterized membrane protein YgdD (TMEM256/DUF423 family)
MKLWLFLSALMGMLAVIFGAFAAHGLKSRLGADALSVFETGARYQMYHALAMGLAAFAIRGPAARWARWAAISFLAGIILFSGSLYLLALTGNSALGIVTPFGGLLFIAGWGLLARAALLLP